ncbi:TPA: M23 family metallopeptidase, partial [Neisseria gonorrhoeae]
MAVFPLSAKHRKYALRALAVSIILVSAAYIASTEGTERVRPQRVEQKLPPLSWGGSGVQTAYWVQEAVQPGDSLADVLARSGMARDEIARITEKYGGEADLRHLRADQSVHVLVGGDGSAREVQFFTDEDGERNLVALEKKGGIWRRSASDADMKVLPTLRSVVVKTSARGSLARAEVPVEIRESLSGIFAGRFSLDGLKEGDAVRLLYDSLYFHGQQVAAGDILAAEVVKGDTTHQAFYYRSDKEGGGGGNYYDEDGRVLQEKGGFNIEPLVYTRISSPFGYRMHPILHTWRLHTGIDYAAPQGTPVRASADGVITFKGRKGGYGNAVMIRHSNGVETLYA